MKEPASLEYVMSMGSSETGSGGVAPVCCWSIAEHWQIVKQLASTNRRALPLVCKAKLDCSMTTSYHIIIISVCFLLWSPCKSPAYFITAESPRSQSTNPQAHLAQVCVTCMSIWSSSVHVSVCVKSFFTMVGVRTMFLFWSPSTFSLLPSPNFPSHTLFLFFCFTSKGPY